MSMLWVNGVVMPSPSSTTWGLYDNSASDAGRVQDENDTMYKNRTSQKRKLDLSWNGVSNAEASKILQAVNPEYFKVKYWDVLDNKYETREFYVGDRTAPFWRVKVDEIIFQNVSFNIVER